MSNSDLPQRIHVVVSDRWQDAVTSLLQPASDHRPWRHGSQTVTPGEPVVMLLDTEPRSVVTSLGRVGVEGGLDRIDADEDEHWLMPVSALGGPDFGFDDDVVDTWLLEGEVAEQLAAELDRHRFWDGAVWGHHTMAAAAIVLRSDGRCAGCHRRTRSGLEAWTVDLDGGDYPVALCKRCRRRIADNGFGTFLDFKLAQNPDCPECGAHRTLSVAYGMPVQHLMVPWHRYAGCCVSAEEWSCVECDHSW